MARKLRPAPEPLRPPAGPLDDARAAFDRGDVRRAREILKPLVASAGEHGQEAARELWDRTKPDPRALVAIAVVLAMIVLAASLGLFRH